MSRDSPWTCPRGTCPGTVPGRVCTGRAQGLSLDVSAKDVSAEGSLGLVLAAVREAKQRLDIRGLAREVRRAGAEREPAWQVAAQLELRETRPEASDEPAPGVAAGLEQQHRELVPAHAARDIGAAQGREHHGPDPVEHPVALHVAELVVDLLEPV